MLITLNLHNICILKILETNHSPKKIISYFLTIPLNSDTDIKTNLVNFITAFVVVLNPTLFYRSKDF